MGFNRYPISYALYMPWIGCEPWERKLLRGKPTQLIPLSDEAAWATNYNNNWVYNKVALCRRQNIPAWPHGVLPGEMGPVFSKPITNLWGMGHGSKIIDSVMDEEGNFDWDHYLPGHFTMPLLLGPETSSDVVMLEGKVYWSATWRAHKDPDFTHWSRTHECPKFAIKKLEKLLPEYTGALTVEVIAGVITDLGLRATPQWIDMYGPRWQESLIQLYDSHTWTPPLDVPNVGYSFVLTTQEKGEKKIDPEVWQRVRRTVHSIQCTFYSDCPLEEQYGSGRSHRLAIVNGFDPWGCQKAVDILGKHGIK